MIARLLRMWRDRPDKALRLQTPVPKFTGHDQTKGSTAYARSRTQTPSGRPIPRPVPADTDTRAKVVQMPKTSRG